MLESFIPSIGIAVAGALAWAIRTVVKHGLKRRTERAQQQRTLEEKANQADRTEGKLLLDRFTVLGEQQETFTDGLIASTQRLSDVVAKRDRTIERLRAELAEQKEKSFNLALELRAKTRELDDAIIKIHRLQTRLDGYAQGRAD